MIICTFKTPFEKFASFTLASLDFIDESEKYDNFKQTFQLLKLQIFKKK